MKNAIVLDWYTNKYLIINKIPEDIQKTIKLWEKIVYEQPDQKSWAMKLSIGTLISWSAANKDKNLFSADFVRVLEWEEKEEFNTQQEIALKIFPTFKREFQSVINLKCLNLNLKCLTLFFSKFLVFSIFLSCPWINDGVMKRELVTLMII